MTFVIPNTMRFLESLGFVFELDWDDELTIQAPVELTPFAVIEALKLFDEAIVASLKRQGKDNLARFLGGPFDGKPHHWIHLNCGGYGIQYRGIKVRRARWAVYRVESDGDCRAIFCGYATSEKKARAGTVTEAPISAKLWGEEE